MRQIHCDKCGARYPKSETKLLFRGDKFEPAEYGRIVKGIALTPKAEQRTNYINGVPYPLELEWYDCDSCGEIINPGDKATCITVWTSRQNEPAKWEHEYIKY